MRQLNLTYHGPCPLLGLCGVESRNASCSVSGEHHYSAASFQCGIDLPANTCQTSPDSENGDLGKENTNFLMTEPTRTGMSTCNRTRDNASRCRCGPSAAVGLGEGNYYLPLATQRTMQLQTIPTLVPTHFCEPTSNINNISKGCCFESDAGSGVESRETQKYP